MGIRRRQLLQASAAGSLLAVVLPLSATAADTGLRAAVMPDGAALPRFAAGQRLAVDTSRTLFDADGIYLYPAWGSPRPWLVSLGPQRMLEFRNPGSGQLAWVQSAQMSPRFAGKLLDPAGRDLRSLADLPPLRVPALPA